MTRILLSMFVAAMILALFVPQIAVLLLLCLLVLGGAGLVWSSVPRFGRRRRDGRR